MKQTDRAVEDHEAALRMGATVVMRVMSKADKASRVTTAGSVTRQKNYVGDCGKAKKRSGTTERVTRGEARA